PVAGADRLKLTEHIAIIDLMNLADALLLPQDDLALAVALKSPLFGLTEDDLFKLAWQRKGSLRQALSQHAATEMRIKAALARLEQCERRFVRETPFALYAWLLGGEGGGAEVVVWAGRKADDPAVVADARTAMLAEIEDEYRRLLYVAMTRAADRLIVGGCMPGNMNNVRKACWYDLVSTGLANSGLRQQTIETPDGPIKRYSRTEDVAAPAGAVAALA